jgi:hypothetical protein
MAKSVATCEPLPSMEHRQHRYLNKDKANSPSQPASENAACKGLNHPHMPSVSSPPLVPSPPPSILDGIDRLSQLTGMK